MTVSEQESYEIDVQFQSISKPFYDFIVQTEFEDAVVIGWCEWVGGSELKDEPLQPMNEILREARPIERDLSHFIELKFEDVLALNIRLEGLEAWNMDQSIVPKLGESPNRNFPILRIENSLWKKGVFPEWRNHLIGETSHWRLISLTNSVDIIARDVSHEWKSIDN